MGSSDNGAHRFMFPLLLGRHLSRGRRGQLGILGVLISGSHHPENLCRCPPDHRGSMDLESTEMETVARVALME